MTLDEAIAIADEIGKGDTVRAANNRWLAEKLRILKWVEECHVIDEARMAREEMHGWQAECVRLKAENEKLRELAREMHATISDRNSWWDCTYKDTRRFADSMRELRIEV